MRAHREHGAAVPRGDLRFTSPPALGPLLARGAARGLRSGGSGGQLPSRAAVMDGLRTDPARLAAYARLCGYSLRDRLPATWLHVVTFPLQAALMAEPDFPFGLAGLVHVGNEMTVSRSVAVTDELALAVHAQNARPHRRGVMFDMVAEVRVRGSVAWSGRSTYLAPGAVMPDAEGAPSSSPDATAPAEIEVVASQRWRLPADLGRRYAAVSGDVNPIHLSPLTSRLFGYRRPLAHGMWTHARALAALENRLPEAYSVAVTFTRPLLLPTTAGFGVRAGDDGSLAFVVSRRDGKPALVGEVRPAQR